MKIFFPFFFVLVFSTAALPATIEEQIIQIMKEELQRNKEKLVLEGYEAPYYIAYFMRDNASFHVNSRYGAVFSPSKNYIRSINAEVRVGSYELDSSEDGDLGFSFSLMPKYNPDIYLPIENDPVVLKRSFWLLTDFKYKNALISYAKVKGKGVYNIKKEGVASFSREESVKSIAKIPPQHVDEAVWSENVKKLSAIARNYNEIFDSYASFTANRIVKYFVNTEGTEVVTYSDYYAITITVMTRAEDGMFLDDSLVYYARKPESLPDFNRLHKETVEMIETLIKVRKAPVLDPQTVPAILMPEAAAVFFHETIGHRLEGQRLGREEEGQTFKGQIGQKILPDFIDIYDDPTVNNFRGVELNGWYEFDEEGVKAQKVSLVENGILKGFLMSRKPVEGFNKSNGHGRSNGFQAPVGRMANLFIKSTKSVKHAQLKEMLIEEVKKQGKKFGLIIKKVSGGSTNTTVFDYQAFKGVPKIMYKVDPETGKEELVRGVEIVGTPLTSIGKTIATSDEIGVFNGYCGAESGSIPVSAIAPAILFKEIELQKGMEMKERGFLIAPP